MPARHARARHFARGGEHANSGEHDGYERGHSYASRRCDRGDTSRGPLSGQKHDQTDDLQPGGGEWRIADIEKPQTGNPRWEAHRAPEDRPDDRSRHGDNDERVQPARDAGEDRRGNCELDQRGDRIEGRARANAWTPAAAIEPDTSAAVAGLVLRDSATWQARTAGFARVAAPVRRPFLRVPAPR